MEGRTVMVDNQKTFMNKMRILYLLNTFPRISSETVIVNEIVELIKLGHEIKILAHDKEWGKIHEKVIQYNLPQNTIYTYVKEYKRGTEKALDFIIKAFSDLIKNPFKTVILLFWAVKNYENIWHLFDSYLGSKKILNSEFDVVYTPFAYLNCLFHAFYISKILKKPFVVTFRAVDIYEKFTKKQLKSKIKLVKKSAGIITISTYNETNIVEKFGIKNKIEIVHSSTDIDYFKPTGDKKKRKIVSICRFIEKKGIKYLIKACNILKNKGVNFECLLIGDGPLKNEYKELMERYKLKEHINIKGFLVMEEIKKELSDSMVFVLPCIIAKNGDRDILPNVLKEAMAMEIPVITSDICGIEELIENKKNGILVPPKNPRAIADAIEKLFAEKELREELGKAAREKIKNDFNVKKEAKKLEGIFSQVVFLDNHPQEFKNISDK